MGKQPVQTMSEYTVNRLLKKAQQLQSKYEQIHDYDPTVKLPPSDLPKIIAALEKQQRALFEAKASEQQKSLVSSQQSQSTAQSMGNFGVLQSASKSKEQASSSTAASSDMEHKSGDSPAPPPPPTSSQ